MSLKYILAPYVRLSAQAKLLYLGFGSIHQRVYDETLQPLIVEIAYYWLSPRTEAEILSHFSTARGFDRAMVQAVVELLKDGHFLLPQLDEAEQFERYQRNLLYFGLSGADPPAVQRRLQQKHVAILGCGGIGNVIAASLATAGIGHLTLVDHDVIELSNLTRQFLFTEQDLGRLKVDALAAALKARNHHVNIDPIDRQISAKADLESLPVCDLIVLSADSPDMISFWTNEFCLRRGTPFINVGYVEDIAVWGPFVIPGQTGCFECRSLFVSPAPAQPRIAALIKAINQRHQAPSTAPVNMLSASQALLDILRYLGEFGTIQSLNKRIGMRTHNLTIETQDCSKNPHCERCSPANSPSPEERDRA